ncbi:MAG: type I pantothenate kinase, partial [Phenylobacterium sp.]
MSLPRILDLLAPLRPAAGPFIVGVTGSVAVGKSTFAQALADHLAAAGAARVEIACTDGFLHPNAVLEARGLLGAKGAPDTYDHDALRAALTAIRSGPAQFPAYSHVVYDIDPALTRRLDPPDVLVIEGLTLRHPDTGPAGLLDALIYLDAAEADLERWYVARFLELWAAAEHDPASFYARFRHMTREQTDGLARMVWRDVNLKNLHDHIIHARARA